MKKGVYEIRQLTKTDLQSISKIHVKTFKDSALSKLGIIPTQRYYTSLLKRSLDNCNIGVLENGNRLLGFCFSGHYSGSFTNFINQNKVFLFFWVLFHPWLLFNPMIQDRVKMSLLIFKGKFKSSQNYPRLKAKSFGILSIAVDPGSQSMGVGNLMMEYVEQEAIKKGFKYMHLTVHPTNDQAVKFYEHNGWEKKVVGTDNWTGFMEKTIDWSISENR
jgi:GNAT superfamily N-acetyltransferase